MYLNVYTGDSLTWFQIGGNSILINTGGQWRKPYNVVDRRDDGS